MTTWITICDTCNREDRDGRNRTRTDGEIFADHIEPLADGPIRTRRFSCLMGCTRACNVTIQAADKADKIAYSLGEFTPDADSAKAVVTFARLYADSRTGQVPYRQWPDAIKGHFISRHLPLPPTDRDS